MPPERGCSAPPPHEKRRVPARGHQRSYIGQAKPIQGLEAGVLDKARPVAGGDDQSQTIAAQQGGDALYQCVQLIRAAVFGLLGWDDLFRVSILVGFGLLMWRIAIRAMTKKLID